MCHSSDYFENFLHTKDSISPRLIQISLCSSLHAPSHNPTCLPSMLKLHQLCSMLNLSRIANSRSLPPLNFLHFIISLFLYFEALKLIISISSSSNLATSFWCCNNGCLVRLKIKPGKYMQKNVHKAMAVRAIYVILVL